MWYYMFDNRIGVVTKGFVKRLFRPPRVLIVTT